MITSRLNGMTMIIVIMQLKKSERGTYAVRKDYFGFCHILLHLKIPEHPPQCGRSLFLTVRLHGFAPWTLLEGRLTLCKPNNTINNIISHHEVARVHYVVCQRDF